jgi:adenylate cyclase
MDEALSIPRRLAAILAADIAGYSRLMHADEAATVQDLKAHQCVILPLIGRHGGRIIDTAGDGILAEFPSVIGATACAVEIQTVMAERNKGVPESRRMRFRIFPIKSSTLVSAKSSGFAPSQAVSREC